MARLQRVTSKVFAENATEVGQFGSLNAGTKVTTTDISTIQALPAWQNGWQAATVGENCYPTLQERNGLDKVQSYFLNYLLQEGIPEWDSGTTYYIGSIVKLINGTNVQLYQSLKDNNTAALSDTTSWKAYDYADLTLSNVKRFSDSFADLLSQWLTLNGQTNVFNSFVEALNNANIRTIKDIYVNGTSGYIIFSNDFCVQWGFVSTAFKTTTVSFLKQMQNTNYLVLLGGITSNSIPRVTDNTLTISSLGLSRQGETNSRGWWCIAGYANLSITTYNVYLGVNTSNTNYTNNGNYRITASGQGSSFSRDNTYTLNTPVTNCKSIHFYYKDSHSTGHYVTTTVYVVDSRNNEIEVYSRKADWNVAQTAVSYSLSNITVKAIRIYTSVGVDVNGYHNSTTTIENIQLIK